MNIIDIVKNAPEGAERYKVFGGGRGVDYYKIINGVKTFYWFSTNHWRGCRDSSYDQSLPIPKLKTEWVKVEDSIFDLAPELKAGELYCGSNGDESVKCLVKTESHLVFLRHEGRPIYRKVEKVIDEKQEFLDEFDRVFKLWHNADTYTRAGNLAEFFHGHGFRFMGAK